MILNNISINDNISTEMGIILNKTDDLQLLEKYKNSKYFFIKEAIIKNENCPGNILEYIFLNENDCSLRLNILNNKNCPFHILKNIYKNYESFRYAVKNHPNWELIDFE